MKLYVSMYAPGTEAMLSLLLHWLLCYFRLPKKTQSQYIVGTERKTKPK